jgi:transcriptional regulator with XRE-family HTH domain
MSEERKLLMATFGERINRAAAKLKKPPKPTHIAREIGVNPTTFSRWMAREKEPKIDLEVYDKIAEVLQCDIIDILPPRIAARLRERPPLFGTPELGGKTAPAIAHTSFMVERLELAVGSLQNAVITLKALIAEISIE